jgi:Recombinase.
VTWGKRKSFSDGNISLPYKSFLGYVKGENGLPQIVEDEAMTIRLIYKLFLEGHTPSSIAKQLMSLNILSPTKRQKWPVSTVISILKNEKYKGDAILQKRYTTDFLTKKTKTNEGEVPQYYVEKLC